MGFIVAGSQQGARATAGVIVNPVKSVTAVFPRGEYVLDLIHIRTTMALWPRRLLRVYIPGHQSALVAPTLAVLQWQVRHTAGGVVKLASWAMVQRITVESRLRSAGTNSLAPMRVG